MTLVTSLTVVTMTGGDGDWRLEKPVLGENLVTRGASLRQTNPPHQAYVRPGKKVTKVLAYLTFFCYFLSIFVFLCHLVSFSLGVRELIMQNWHFGIHIWLTKLDKVKALHLRVSSGNSKKGRFH